jgi:hypothetical protein
MERCTFVGGLTLYGSSVKKPSLDAGFVVLAGAREAQRITRYAVTGRQKFERSPLKQYIWELRSPFGVFGTEIAQVNAAETPRVASAYW